MTQIIPRKNGGAYCRTSSGFKAIAVFLALAVFFSSLSPLALSEVVPAPQPASSVYNLPLPTKLLSVSEKFSYPVLKGLRFNPKNPLNIEFLVDTANKDDVSKEEADRLIKYFLAGLTLPQEELWVNLSPFEGERVASDNLALTDLGKDLLGQDYCLKQLVSSLTYPGTELGKRYWDSVTAVMKDEGRGMKDVNTYNKVWVMPQKSVVYEKGDTAFVLEASLKVMHERDYVAQQRNLPKDEGRGMKDEKTKKDEGGRTKDEKGKTEEIASRVFKEVILPEVNQEVNHGKNFATLRQIYNSLVLAVWFRKKFKDSFYKSYIDKGKISGIDLKDKNVKDKIFNLYVEAYKKGVYNCVKKEERLGKNPVRRRYTSGGMVFGAEAFRETMRVELNLQVGVNPAANSCLGRLKAVGSAFLTQEELTGKEVGRALGAVDKDKSVSSPDAGQKTPGKAKSVNIPWQKKLPPFDFIIKPHTKTHDLLGIANNLSGVLLGIFPDIASQLHGISPLRLALDYPVLWIGDDEYGTFQISLSGALDNAIDGIAKEATRQETEYKGMIEVSFSVEHDRLVIKVSDNGIGITVDTLGRLFSDEPVSTKKRREDETLGRVGTDVRNYYGDALVNRYGGTIEFDTYHHQDGAHVMRRYRSHNEVSVGHRITAGTTVTWTIPFGKKVAASPTLFRPERAVPLGSPTAAGSIAANGAASINFPIFTEKFPYMPPGALSTDARQIYLGNAGDKKIVADILTILRDSQLSSVDKGRVASIVGHLVDNAVDAVYERIDNITDDSVRGQVSGKAAISFFIQRDSQTGGTRVILSDNGAGIRKDIFQSWVNGEYRTSKPLGRGYATRSILDTAKGNFEISFVSERENDTGYQFTQYQNGKRIMDVSNENVIGTTVIITFPRDQLSPAAASPVDMSRRGLFLFGLLAGVAAVAGKVVKDKLRILGLTDAGHELLSSQPPQRSYRSEPITAANRAGDSEHEGALQNVRQQFEMRKQLEDFGYDKKSRQAIVHELVNLFPDLNTYRFSPGGDEAGRLKELYAAIKGKFNIESGVYPFDLNVVLEVNKANCIGGTQLFLVLARALRYDAIPMEVVRHNRRGWTLHIASLVRLPGGRSVIVDLANSEVGISQPFILYDLFHPYGVYLKANDAIRQDLPQQIRLGVNDGMIRSYLAVAHRDDAYITPYPEQLELYRKALKSDPNNIHAYMGISVTYTSIGIIHGAERFLTEGTYFNKALGALRKALELSPDSLDVLDGFRELYRDTHMPEKEAEVYARKIKIIEREIPAVYRNADEKISPTPFNEEKKGLVFDYLKLVELYHEIGEPNQERSAAIKALAILEKLVPTDYHYTGGKKGIGYSRAVSILEYYKNMADLYRLVGNKKQAEKYSALHRSLEEEVTPFNGQFMGRGNSPVATVKTKSAASPLPLTGSTDLTDTTGSTPLGGIDVTANNFNLETKGEGLDKAITSSPLNPNFDSLQFVITFMKDVSAKETIDELAGKAWGK